MAEPNDSQRGEDATTELKRRRRENEIFQQEQNILKRATSFCQGWAEGRAPLVQATGERLRFELIDRTKKDFPVQRHGDHISKSG